MKTRFLTAFAAALVCIVSVAGLRAAAPPPEVNAIVAQVQQKIRAGQTSPAALAPELAAMDALRAKFDDHDPETAARIAVLQYTLCRNITRDTAQAETLRGLLASKYRRYAGGSAALAEIEREEGMAKRREVQAGAIGKPAPDLRFTWSTRPDLTKLSQLKGKVVVIDFWATWCGPCIATFPQIRELVAHYQGADVVVLGVTSLQGYVANLTPARIDTRNDPEKEYALMPEFIKAKGMTWPVAFSDERVFDPRYGVEGIPHMTIIAPDGTVRHNGLHPGMPHAEKLAMIDALLKEFGKLPGARSGD